MREWMHRHSWALGVAIALPAACSDDGPQSSAGETSTGAEETGFATFPTTGFGSTGAASGTEPDTDGDAEGAECSLYDQDCPEGEKCVPWSDQPDLVPDDIRCCPEVGSPKQVGDDCTVEGYFGSCLDDCVEGSFCLDIDGDGAGRCQALCQGSTANPICDTDQTCFIYFAGVPLCFNNCDPLIQDCPDGEGCYPDDVTAGGTGFICMPVVGSGDIGDNCWLLSNCLPGLLCVTPDFLADCNGLVGCCTPICDVTEADVCAEIHPDLECVSWYISGQAPPSVELQNVGACALPP